MSEATLFGPSAEPRGPYVRIALQRRLGSRDEPLTYRAPSLLPVGQLVDVPLGTRSATGVVVAAGGDELLDRLAPSKLRAVARVRPARLPPQLVDLARWMAGYYVCPLGTVLATMIPAAVRREVGSVREVRPAPADRIASVLAGVTLATRRLAEAALSLDWSASRSAAALARELGLKTSAAVRRLQQLGVLEEVEAQRVSSPAPSAAGVESRGPGSISLTPAQHAVIEGVAPSLSRFTVHVLHGVTGSGKTEVYMALAERALGLGLASLILVPEIGLTPQLAGRFTGRFGPRIALLHSGLSPAERARQWARAASDARVIIGARSALFTPTPRLGLIVVDEEHASDYKQDQAPRFHARDAAIKRAQLESCPIVLGSATPSLETWANAASGRYTLWRLPERVGGWRMPRVEIVDVARDRREHGQPGFQTLGPTLRGALRETLDAGGQSILLVNRRGLANYICCQSPACGWVLTCAECDASLVVHRARAGRLARCHHCLAEQILPTSCPVCGTRTIAIGAGTQRVEEELAAFSLTQGHDLVRADGDTMRTAKDWTATLEGLASGRVRVLVGTQMVAKGLDFPNVRLVGVVNADSALTLPDFRADERTFQLVSQVAGRAGRSDSPGRVIVQTVNPAQPAIALAAAHDYEGFADRELALRREAGLPPSTRLARIVARDEDSSVAAARAGRLAESLRAVPGLRVEGPAPCPIARIAGQHRIAVDAYAPDAAMLARTLGDLRARGLLLSDAKTAVDVDPVALV
ncbi:MAG: primosomal protein N' [Phycisphaerae bacterium]|nr:primosomal protein N' [Phycisphaerae bacterium]